MKVVDVIAAVLLVVGGLNWGLVGIAQFDLVAFICGGLEFGSVNALSRLIYIVVGVAAVYQAVSVKAIQRRWHMQLAT